MHKALLPYVKKWMQTPAGFKWMLNLSPMYRRTTARIFYVSDDLLCIKIKLKRSYKNLNIAGTIFGGSLFAATDPIYMTQLMMLLNNEFIVWDKASTIRFKRPAKNKVFGEFTYTKEEVAKIKENTTKNGSIDFIKRVFLKDSQGKIIAEVDKTIYVATKRFYAAKRKQK